MTDKIISYEDPKEQSDDVFGKVRLEDERHMMFDKTEIRDVPQKEWMVKNLFGANDIVFIYGQPSTGKTFVAIDLMMAVISGKPFANTFEVARPLTVAMVVGEGGTSIRDRLIAAEDYNEVPQWANYFIFANGLQLYEDDNGEEIDSFIREWRFKVGKPLDVLIIDTYAMSTVGADENSVKATGKVLHNAHKIANALGSAIIFVHHTTKNGSAERGSSSLRAAADMMIEIGDGRMKCTKAKHCEMWKPIEFSLEPFESSLVVEWSVADVMEDKIISLLNSNIGTRFTMNEILERIGNAASHMTIKNAVKKAVSCGAIKSELRNLSTKNSPTNPMTYFVEEW